MRGRTSQRERERERTSWNKCVRGEVRRKKERTSDRENEGERGRTRMGKRGSEEEREQAGGVENE